LEDTIGEKVHYILDEIGQQLLPHTSDNENYFNSTIIEHNGCMYTVIWPETSIEEGTVVECKGLPSGAVKTNKLFSALTNSMEYEHSELKSILLTNEYNVTTIMSRLGLSTAYGLCLPVWDLPKEEFKSKFSSDTSLDILVSLFLLGSSIPLFQLEKVLGSSLVTALDSMNALYIDSSSIVTSLIQISPVCIPCNADSDHHNTVYLATDFAYVRNLRFEPVMYIGPDSLALLHGLPYGRGTTYANLLDLCAGSAVQAICAASGNLVESATCIELNERAIRFANFNIRLNNVESKVRVECGNVCDPALYTDVLSEAKYDIVVLNPPYIPTGCDGGDTPSFLQAYGCGGKHGDDLIAAVISNMSASAIIADECAVAIVGNIANVNTFPQRLKTWSCGAGGGAMRASNISIFHGNLWSCDVYAGLIIRLQHQADAVYQFHDDALVEKYASDLSSSGVTDVSNCLVFFNFTNSNEFNFRINFEADLWAKLAINDQLARALKDKITQYLQ
jgi:predicted RNA methylase